MTGVAAVILAGGLALRMGGGDKALVTLAGQPLLAHVLERISPQVSAVALSANGDPERFAAFALPVLPDTLPGRPGPLAGVLAGMRWVQRDFSDIALLLTVPTDTPRLPADLVARLLATRKPATPIVCAASLGRTHPVVALWPVSLAESLHTALSAGVRSVREYAAQHSVAEVDFPAAAGDPFFNINSPADLAAADDGNCSPGVIDDNRLKGHNSPFRI